MTFGAIYKGYISNLDPMLDRREILPQLIDRTNERATFLDLFRFDQRRMVPTTETNFHNFVNAELFSNETIIAAPTDVSATYSLPAGTVVDVKVSGINGTSFFMVDDIVRVPGALRRTAQVIAKTAHATGDILRLKGVNQTDIQAANGQVLALSTSAKGEGGKFSDSRRYPVTRRSGWVQISAKEIAKITDIQKETRIEFSVNGEDRWLPKAMIEGDMLQKKEICLQMLFGEPSTQDNFAAATPNLTDADGNPVNVSKSLNSYIAASGVTFSNQAINQAFFEALTRQLNKLRAGDKYFVWGGSEMSIAWDVYFQALGSADLSSAARFMVDGDSLRLGVHTVRYFDRDFARMNMSIFDDPFTVSFTGSAGFHKEMFLIPGNDVPTLGGGSVPRIRCRYLPVPNDSGANVSSNGIYRQTILGNYAPVATNDERKVSFTQECKMGLQILGEDQFVRVFLT